MTVHLKDLIECSTVSREGACQLKERTVSSRQISTEHELEGNNGLLCTLKGYAG